MNKIKMFFKYLWENLFDRYSVVVLNNYTKIFFLFFIFFVFGLFKAESGGGLVFFFLLVWLFFVNCIIFVVLNIIFYLENRGKIKKIENTIKFNNKFYKTFSLISVLNVLLHYLICVIFLIAYVILFFFEDFIRYWANAIKYGL